MRRRLDSPGEFNVWPAFTDVLGGLVVVLVFLITLFVIGEVLIGREMTGKDSAITQLQDIIEHLENLTGTANAEANKLRGELQDRDALLRTARAELSTAQTELAQTRTQAQTTQSQLQEQAALLSARTEQLAAELARLNQALLGREQTLAERDSQLQNQAERIAQMDKLIKERLLDRVEQLERYASDFYGRLKEVFANNPNIKVVGDRFVFQSEVLFPSGAADLTVAGEHDLDKFVAVYQQLAAQIPKELNVIIEVQGHTDKVPISNNPHFANNWELSAQRALDVVYYLIERGIPAERLAAVGMGEYHPIDTSDNPEAYRRNRRIELKITSR